MPFSSSYFLRLLALTTILSQVALSASVGYTTSISQTSPGDNPADMPSCYNDCTNAKNCGDYQFKCSSTKTRGLTAHLDEDNVESGPGGGNSNSGGDGGQNTGNDGGSNSGPH